MGVRRPQGDKTGVFHPLEIGTKNQKFLEVSRLIRIDLIIAVTVYLPESHSHCTRTGFTAVVSCSDELAVHSYPLLSL